MPFNHCLEFLHLNPLYAPHPLENESRIQVELAGDGVGTKR